MEIDLTTPALLFPAISLLMLAYTNRFLALAALVRQLHGDYQVDPNQILVGEIENLRYRIKLIVAMQVFGIASLLFCVICMFLLFAGKILLGEIIFGASLALMMISLGILIREIQVSVGALNLHLSDLESSERGRKK